MDNEIKEESMRLVKCLFIFILVFVLYGCITNKVTYDSSVSKEQQVTLEIPGTLSVTEFNGSKVDWGAGFWGKKTVVNIPPGLHVLTADYSSSERIGNMRKHSRARGLKIQYDFQPGIIYKLSYNISGKQIYLKIEEINPTP